MKLLNNKNIGNVAIVLLVVLLIGIVVFFFTILRPSLEKIAEVKEEILKSPEEENLQEDKLLETNGEYQIVYIEKDDLFLLTLHSLPLDEARAAAEQALLEKSGGNLKVVCELNVQIGAPRWVRCPSEDICVQNVDNPTSLDICR